LKTNTYRDFNKTLLMLVFELRRQIQDLLNDDDASEKLLSEGDIINIIRRIIPAFSIAQRLRNSSKH